MVPFIRVILWLQPFFVERAFRIFDCDGNGTVSMSEFIDTMHQFAGQSSDEKLVFLFRVYDLDGERYIVSQVHHSTYMYIHSLLLLQMTASFNSLTCAR